MTRRLFWLCAVYRITHDDFVFRWVESEKQPHYAGVGVFEHPFTVYDDEDPAERLAAIPHGPAPEPTVKVG